MFSEFFFRIQGIKSNQQPTGQTYKVKVIFIMLEAKYLVQQAQQEESKKITAIAQN